MESILGIAVGLFVVFGLIRLLSKRSFISKTRRKSHLTCSTALQLDVDYETALNKSKEAIRLFNLKLERFEPERGIFVGLTGVNWLTIGEIITISHTRKNNGVEVAIESTPAISLLLVDYGRNKKNVEALTNLIKV